MADLRPGSEFAGHRIEGVAGRGGMGTVYRATHIALDHEVALKVISAELAADEAFRERFRSESRIAVSLRHPNVVPVHHAGEEDGLLFVTMDLIDGPDLRRLLIAGGAMQPARAAALLTQVAGALDVAHSRGLVHRDIKPGNVLVEQREGEDPSERAYLTDFGLAKRFDQSGAALTATGGFVGTLDYVAPEQIKGDRIDARTDVYALGCVLYETLVGQPPFGDRQENVSKMYAHLQDEPPWLPGDVDDDLDEVIARALAKEPRERFPSAGDLARAATAAASGVEETVVERSVARGPAAPKTPVAPTPPPIAPTVESPPSGSDAPIDPTVRSPPPSSEPRTELDGEPQVAAGGGGLKPPPALERTREDRTPATPARTDRPDPADPPPRSAAAGRRRLGLLAALAAAAFAAAAALLLLGGGSGDDSSGPAIDGDPIAVKGFPVGLAIHDNLVSVATREGGALVSFRKESRKQVGEAIELGGKGEDVAIAAGSAWVTMPDSDTVARIELDGDGVPVGAPQLIPVGTEPRGIAADDDGTVWVADFGSSELTRIDAKTGTPAPVPLGDGAEPADVAFDGDTVWVSDRAGSVVKIPKRGKPQPFPVGNDPKGIAVLDGFVWVAVTGDGKVMRMTTEGAEGFEVDVGGIPRGVAADPDRNLIWVANGDGYVTAIDPDDLGNPQRVDVDGSPEDVAVGPLQVWVTSGEGDELNSIVP